jgi:ABC-type transport system involved in cytochrome c biogenesis permease subunit
MSNGYESMIFISWITLLAGFFFRRRSPFALPATAVLSGLTLLVAHMSFMDPEITNLVPVLQSYWLTLHVSVITASYGFLGLGAVLQ